ncbi:uncharacterized protein ACIB01_010017 isoform 1-T1 [Guaruba guarouba]
MEAGEVKQALRVLKEQLEERSAEARRCKERLQCWAAEADRAAISVSMQSSTQQAGSKELLQHMDGTHEDPFDAVQQLRSQEENHLACTRAWLWEDQQKDKVVPKEPGQNRPLGSVRLEEASAGSEPPTLLSPRFCISKWRSWKRPWRSKRRGTCWPGDVVSATGCSCSPCSWSAWSWLLASVWLLHLSARCALILSSFTACSRMCFLSRPTATSCVRWEGFSLWSVRGCCPLDIPSPPPQ